MRVFFEVTVCDLKPGVAGIGSHFCGVEVWLDFSSTPWRTSNAGLSGTK